MASTGNTILLAFVCLMVSCQSARELHYFKEGDNYYRLRIKEKAFLSSSRYISGYFDENAVNRYFGEIKRPDSLQFINQKKATDGKASPYQDDSKLVLILSTNSEVVAKQIGNLAKNEEILEILARLANKDKISENKSLMATADSRQRMNANIIQLSDQFIGGLDSAQISGDTLYLQQSMIAYINYLAALTGENIQFKNIEQAQIWYRTRYSK